MCVDQVVTDRASETRPSPTGLRSGAFNQSTRRKKPSNADQMESELNSMLRRAMKEKESRVHITQRPAEGDDDDILKLVRMLDIGSSLSPTDSTFNPHKLLKLISIQRRNVQSYLSDTSSSQTIYNSLHHDSFLPDNECGGTRNGRRFVHLLRSQITHTTATDWHQLNRH